MYTRKVLETLSALRPTRGSRGRICGAFRDSYIKIVHISARERDDREHETGLSPHNRHFTVTVTRTDLALSWYLANGIARSLAAEPQFGKLGPRSCGVVFYLHMISGIFWSSRLSVLQLIMGVETLLGIPMLSINRSSRRRIPELFRHLGSLYRRPAHH